MAVALDGGLITPTLRKANTMDIYSLGREWKELVSKAKQVRHGQSGVQLCNTPALRMCPSRLLSNCARLLPSLLMKGSSKRMLDSSRPERPCVLPLTNANPDSDQTHAEKTHAG